MIRDAHTDARMHGQTRQKQFASGHICGDWQSGNVLGFFSGGYGPADTFSDDRADAIRQRTCQGCAFAWWAFFRQSYWPQSSPKPPKNHFLEKSGHLTEDFQNFATKGFTGTRIHIFQRSFAEIGKAELTKQVRVIHHEKGWYFAPFSVASGAISPKILRDHSFPIPHPSTKFCPNPSSFRGDISENVFQTHYNIGVWSKLRISFGAAIDWFVFDSGAVQTVFYIPKKTTVG